MHTIAEIQQTFGHTFEQGLGPEAIVRSRQQFGANRLTPLPREPLWKKFLEKFDEPIIKILLAAALLSMIVDLFRPPFEAGRFIVGGIVLVLALGAVVAAYVLKQSQWVPSLLFVSAVVLFPVGAAMGHPSYDGLAVMVAVILATGVAFASEYKSDREFEILNAQKESLQVKVLRGGPLAPPSPQKSEGETSGGEFRTIPLEDVVVGDIVILEMGDEIPADGRLIKATDLYVDQSLMTGESEPVRKHARPADETAEGPDQPGCLYRGTQVVDGIGELCVTDVGDATALGQIARKLAAGDEEEEQAEAADTEEKRVKRKLTISKELTPLQHKLEKLADLISKVGYVAAVAIFVALFLRGVIVKEVRFTPTFVVDPKTDEYILLDPITQKTVSDTGGGVRTTDTNLGTLESPGQALLDTAANLLAYFMYMVIIIVVAVPEGLPMSVTVSLALAMRKMTRANSLVRQLVACETIGSATVICSDKTGTLTQNKMQVVRVSWDCQLLERGTTEWVLPAAQHSAGVGPSSNSFPGGERATKPLDWIALNSGVNSTANLEVKDGNLVPVGNSTEGALLQWLHEGKLEYQKLRLQFEPLYQIHFSSERKRMTSVVHYDGRLVALAKGAPEWVLEHSTHYLDDDGSAQPWTQEARQKVQERLKETASRAMRTLAFGHVLLPPETKADEDSLHAQRDVIEKGLIFDGFIAIRDPLRVDVKDAVTECRQAGIEVKMITGDNIETARAIGSEIGLLDRPDAIVMTSQEFNALTDEQLKEQLPRLRILARARPLDKFRMVKMLQELGEVVAVTGDGTNDAPALKKADVGLAMGRAGTEVAKEASKIVLLDDAFSTIVNAVHWGRSLYENIQRFIQFQLTINVSALAIAFLGPFFGVRPPFTILQLLWINVIMDTFAAIALCSEPPRPGIMRQPPKRRDDNILTRPMIQTILSTAAFFIVVMIVLLLGIEHGWWLRDPGGTPSRSFAPITYWQVAVFFSIYVFFQVWNEINCRSLTPEASGFQRLFENWVFLGIVGLIIVGQIVIVSVGGEVFEVQALGAPAWALIALFTASVLIYAEIIRRVRLNVARRSAS